MHVCVSLSPCARVPVCLIVWKCGCVDVCFWKSVSVWPLKRLTKKWELVFWLKLLLWPFVVVDDNEDNDDYDDDDDDDSEDDDSDDDDGDDDDDRDDIEDDDDDDDDDDDGDDDDDDDKNDDDDDDDDDGDDDDDDDKNDDDDDNVVVFVPKRPWTAGLDVFCQTIAWWNSSLTISLEDAGGCYFFKISDFSFSFEY